MSGNEIRKKRIITPVKISKAWISPIPIGGGNDRRSFCDLAACRISTPPIDLRERRVLDDVDEQADEGRQQPSQRLRQDHEGVTAGPAEAERRRGLVLLARDRLDRAARGLGDLGAAPEDERDRGGRQRASNLSVAEISGSPK